MTTPRIFPSKGRIEQDGRIIGYILDELAGIGRARGWVAKMADGRTMKASSRPELVAKLKAEWGFR